MTEEQRQDRLCHIIRNLREKAMACSFFMSEDPVLQTCRESQVDIYLFLAAELEWLLD